MRGAARAALSLVGVLAVTASPAGAQEQQVAPPQLETESGTLAAPRGAQPRPPLGPGAADSPMLQTPSYIWMVPHRDDGPALWEPRPAMLPHAGGRFLHPDIADRARRFSEAQPAAHEVIVFSYAAVALELAYLIATEGRWQTVSLAPRNATTFGCESCSEEVQISFFDGVEQTTKSYRLRQRYVITPDTAGRRWLIQPHQLVGSGPQPPAMESVMEPVRP